MSIILVVDDSPTQSMHIESRLREVGHEVHSARDGRAALEQVEKFDIDLALVDLNMPGMDGLELTKRLTRDRPYLPVVVMTAFGNEANAVAACKAGARSFIRKQQGTRELVKTVDDQLSIAKGAGELEPARDTSIMSVAITEYVVGCDAAAIPSLIAKIDRELTGRGVVDNVEKVRLLTALREAIDNAVYHGNLELSSELREGDQSSFYEEADRRRQLAPYKDRQAVVLMQVYPGEVRFTIRDQGPGFDPSTIPDPRSDENLGKASGRGLLLITTFMDEVRHSPEGNEIILVKRHPEAKRLTPSGPPPGSTGSAGSPTQL